MKKNQRDNILISFFKEREKYKKFAEYVVSLIRDDPSAPKENIHTILYRIKDETRLIEKIELENASSVIDIESITHKNFQERVGDIIGIRIICLRLSDILEVEAYLELLVDEKILQFIRKPDHKRSFVLPLDPGESAPKYINLQYSGYSSIHYQVRLGMNSDAFEDFKDIQIELQLRTILEEAWGEIDHKYRYVYSRIGDTIPEHIHSGFYNLSAYLQAAAMQAEHLCREVEAYRFSTPRRDKRKKEALVAPKYREKKASNGVAYRSKLPPPALQVVLEKTFGFKPSVRTLTYIFRRFDKLGYTQRSKSFFQKILTKKRIQEFISIYREILDMEPFKDIKNQNIDTINAINYILFDELEGSQVAKEGLKSTLQWRKNRLIS